MRRPRAILLPLLLVPLLLAGCAEDMPLPGNVRPGTPIGGDIIGYHQDFERGSRNATLFVLREDGAADRLTFLRDGTSVIRLAPGVSYPPHDLPTLFEPANGTRGRDEGGLILRIERGYVPQAQADALAAALRDEWPALEPEKEEMGPWFRAESFVRVEEPLRMARVSVHDDRAQPGLTPLREAFRAAEAAFVAEVTQEADLSRFAPEDPNVCLRANTSVSPAAFTPGEAVTILVEVTNCGAEEVHLAATPCDGGTSVTPQITGMPASVHALPATETPSAAFALDLQCRGDAPPITIPPGETANLTRAWNGTLAACDADGACHFQPAPPGTYGVVAYTPSQREASPAPVTVLPRDPPSTRFLLVEERDWVNATEGDPGTLFGNFGPHCAPVRYTLDPPVLTIYHHEPEPPATREGIIVRDYRQSQPNHTVTMSADRLAMTPFQHGSARLYSPFAPSIRFVEIMIDGEDFLVNATRLAPGESMTLHQSHLVKGDGDAPALTESVLVLTNVGRAHVVHERVGGCA